MDGFRAALVGLGGRIVATAPGCMTVPADPAAVLDAIVEAGAELLRASGRHCLGAGLPVPLAVAEPDGTALNPLHVAWQAGVPVRELFWRSHARAGVPGPGDATVAVAPAGSSATDSAPGAPIGQTGQTGNDVNLAALAEYRHGAARGARQLLCVATGHRGVGGALVLDGRLHTGSSGLALDVGHLTVHEEGRACHCGSRGCLDVEVDPLAFLTAAGREPGPEVSLLQQARDLLRDEYADPSVRAAAHLLIDRLGRGLAGLVNILNPDRIILGGLHRDLLDADPERLRAVVAERSLWGSSGGVPLLPCTLDYNSPVGAAELALGSRSSTTRSGRSAPEATRAGGYRCSVPRAGRPRTPGARTRGAAWGVRRLPRLARIGVPARRRAPEGRLPPWAARCAATRSATVCS